MSDPEREPEVSLDRSGDGSVLLGVETEGVSVAVSLSSEVSSEDVEDALRTAYQESRHTVRVSGRVEQ